MRLPISVVALAAALACASAAGCAKRPATPPPGPPEVGVITVQPQSVELTTELPGRTVAYAVSDVRPQINGIVKARLFAEGSDVKAGQVLYLIDPAPYQAAFDQARAVLANAQANVTTTRLKAQRYADLVKINAVSRQDYDDAAAQYQQSAATVAQDKASLEAARINLGYTRVTAPISGRIGRSSYTQGALATAGQANAFATIQGLDPIYVDVTQSSDQLLKLKGALAGGRLSGAGPASARVRLILSDGTVYPAEGRLRFAEALVDQTTGSLTLRAVFPNPNVVLLPGMYVREVVVQGLNRTGILAPQQAVSHDEKGQATAYVVDAQNKAELRVLTIDRAIGSSWLITSGLQPGDRLIMEGLLKVQQPGMAVHPVPAGAAAGPGPHAGGGDAARLRPASSMTGEAGSVRAPGAASSE